MELLSIHKTESTTPPLYQASKRGHLEVVRVLHGAGSNLRNIGEQIHDEDRFPSSRISSGHIKVAQLLVEHSAEKE